MADQNQAQPTPQPQTQPAPQGLAAMVRAKYPHVYDDMDDATLEKNTLAKYPQYADLASTPAKMTPQNATSSIGPDNRSTFQKFKDWATRPSSTYSGVLGAPGTSPMQDAGKLAKNTSAAASVASIPLLAGEGAAAYSAGKLLPFLARTGTSLVGAGTGAAAGKYAGRYIGGDTGGTVGETAGGLLGGLAGGGAFGENARTIGNPREVPIVGKYLPDLLPDEEAVGAKVASKAQRDALSAGRNAPGPWTPTNARRAYSASQVPQESAAPVPFQGSPTTSPEDVSRLPFVPKTAAPSPTATSTTGAPVQMKVPWAPKPKPNLVITPEEAAATTPQVKGSYWSFKEPDLRKTVLSGDRDAAVVYKQRFGSLPAGSKYLTDVGDNPNRGLYQSEQ